MDSLPQMTDSQRADVDFLVESLDIRSDLWMILNAGKLKRAAACLGEIHPLRFFEHVGTEDKTRVHFVKMSSARWTAVLDGAHGITGLCEHCERADAEGTMTRGMVCGLLKTLDVAVANFEHMVAEKAWGPLASDIRSALRTKSPEVLVERELPGDHSLFGRISLLLQELARLLDPSRLDELLPAADKE